MKHKVCKGEREMNDFRISELLEMSYKLWEKNKATWSPMEPHYGRNMLLWMVEELGEVISIIKKKGEDEIMSDPELRKAFVEELADVMGYYCEFLNRYSVTAEELSDSFLAKHKHNMERDYETQYKNLSISRRTK